MYGSVRETVWRGVALTLNMCYFCFTGNDLETCFYWTVNLLVPAWNWRFNWAPSCSEFSKREREWGRGRGDVLYRTVVKNLLPASVSYSCSETTWPLQGSMVARLRTLLMSCRDCRVSVFFYSCLTDKHSPPAAAGLFCWFSDWAVFLTEVYQLLWRSSLLT